MPESNEKSVLKFLDLEFSQSLFFSRKYKDLCRKTRFLGSSVWQTDLFEHRSHVSLRANKWA